MEQSARQHYAAVIIGSGFGGTMTALPFGQEFKRRGQGEKTLILERGTWWTTPVGTVQDKAPVKTVERRNSRRVLRVMSCFIRCIYLSKLSARV